MHGHMEESSNGGRRLSRTEFQKYFSPASNLPKIIGGVIIALGVVMCLMRGIMLLLGVVIMAIGAAIFFLAKESRASDEELDGALANMASDLDYQARLDIDVKEKVMSAFRPEVFTEFDYSGAETSPGTFRLVRGADRKYRTNKYTATEIVFTQTKLHICKYSLNLTEEGEDTERLAEKYVDLSSVGIDSETHEYTCVNGKKSVPVKIETRTMYVKKNDGTVAMRFPVGTGADVDRAVEEINRLIRTRKEKAEEDEA